MNAFDWPSHIQFGVSLFALIAPIVGAPIFISLTTGMTSRGRVLCATVACLTAFVVLSLAYFFGEAIMQTMGTSLPSFQIAGGLIIALTGLSMMSDKHVPSTEDIETDSGGSAVRVGISPMGIPMFGGAGAITKMLLEGHETMDLSHEISVIAILAIVLGLSWLILVGAGLLVRFLGKSGILVIERLFGLLLIAIGVEILVTGVLGHADKFALTH
ncbi:MarC family protein [Thalassobaculum salexigens]|uniref:MarC family protein n=1 Tax=Thalassobaculum salexigens TaxID=455360 RepID=UPI00248E253A|nr:MarC family protein [Thalassobaculum salexigens]